jgi:RNA polymerase sigma-70 factor, ECF subfamily
MIMTVSGNRLPSHCPQRPALQPEVCTLPDESLNPSDRVALVQRLFIESQPALHVFVHALVPDFGRAQDVLQETFLAVTRKANDFSPGSNFMAWSSAIARYKVLESLRERRFIGLTPAAIEAVCNSEAAVSADPRIEVLAECIETLTAKTKQVVTLRYQEAHQPAEIARIIGWTPAAVYVALSRARRFLHDCVAQSLAPLKGK